MDNIITATLIVVCIYFIISAYGIIEMCLNKEAWTPEFKKEIKRYPVSIVVIYIISYPFIITGRILNK